MTLSPPTRFLLEAPGVVDACSVSAAPGAILFERGEGDCRVLASGPPRQVRAHPGAASARVEALPDSILVPGLVNAHTHLDLTHIGPVPHDADAGFARWASIVIRGRRHDEAGIRASVRQGAERSLAGGVVAVGDIAGDWSTAPLTELRDSPLRAVSYIECFGMGARQEAAIARLREAVGGLSPLERAVSVGVSPHAPYSAGPRLTAAALDLGLPLQMHLAESADERRFLLEGAGPIRDLLDSLGLWHDSIGADLRRAPSSAAHVLAPLAGAIALARDDAPVLFAHVNDLDDASLALLARSNASVVYCPRCSDYFGAPRAFGRHRYADMLAAGVRVVLGTDSILNLPLGPGGAPPAMSTLEEARLLWRRDGDSRGRLPARRLLAMATTDAAAALGLDPSAFDLSPGPLAGLVAVPVGATRAEHDPARRVLESTLPARLLFHAKDPCRAASATVSAP